MARHGHGEGGGLDQINLDVPHVGMLSALTLLVLTVGLAIMPFRWPRAFLRVMVVGVVLTPMYAWVMVSLGEANLFDHPLLCVPLIVAGLWVSDEIRAHDDERAAKKRAAHAARKEAMRIERMSTQEGTRW